MDFSSYLLLNYQFLMQCLEHWVLSKYQLNEWMNVKMADLPKYVFEWKAKVDWEGCGREDSQIGWEVQLEDLKSPFQSWNTIIKH